MNRFNALGLLLAMVLVGSFTSCVKKEFDEPDNNGCDDQMLQANITIADLKDLYNGIPLLIDQDLIIEGVVTSDDQSGNFFKELVIQDATAGILILVDQPNLYTSYPVGRKVYIKLDSMYMDDYGGLLQLGASLSSEDGSLQRIPQSLLTKYIAKGACNEKVDTINLSTTELDPDKHQSMLIKVGLAKFDGRDAGVTYANPDGNSATNRTLNNCFGTSLIMRNSDFSKFAGETTPTERFDVVGVFSVFNGDFQMKIRTINDVQVRSGEVCPCVDIPDPIKGTTNWFLDDIEIIDNDRQVLLAEDFSGLAQDGILNIPGWNNVTQYGREAFEADNFVDGSNEYAKVSAYRSGSARITSWLITPEVTIAGAGETLSFLSRAEFANGKALIEVLISTDYNGSNSPEDFTWEKICPDMAVPSSGGSGDWYESGDVDLSNYAGQAIYIAFRYRGGDN